MSAKHDNTTHAKVADTGFELVISGAMMAVLGRMSSINDLLSLTISGDGSRMFNDTGREKDALHPDLVKYLLRIHAHLPMCLCACVRVCLCACVRVYCCARAHTQGHE